MVITPARPKTKERRTPSGEQQRQQIASLCRAITTICETWDTAVDAEESRGYGSGGNGEKIGSTSSGFMVPEYDENGEYVGSERVPTVIGDPTSDAALRKEPATEWLFLTKRALALLLKLSVEDEQTGKFYPPDLLSSLLRAAEDVIKMWPKNVALLIERIHKLANQAIEHWPNPIVVGQRSKQKVGEPVREVCAECGSPIEGGAADPIRRIDGAAYHGANCYYREYRRKRSRNSSPKAQQ